MAETTELRLPRLQLAAYGALQNPAVLYGTRSTPNPTATVSAHHFPLKYSHHQLLLVQPFLHGSGRAQRCGDTRMMCSRNSPKEAQLTPSCPPDSPQGQCVDQKTLWGFGSQLWDASTEPAGPALPSPSHFHCKLSLLRGSCRSYTGI